MSSQAQQKAQAPPSSRSGFNSILTSPTQLMQELNQKIRLKDNYLYQIKSIIEKTQIIFPLSEIEPTQEYYQKLGKAITQIDKACTKGLASGKDNTNHDRQPIQFNNQVVEGIRSVQSVKTIPIRSQQSSVVSCKDFFEVKEGQKRTQKGKQRQFEDIDKIKRKKQNLKAQIAELKKKYAQQVDQTLTHISDMRINFMGLQQEMKNISQVSLNLKSGMETRITFGNHPGLNEQTFNTQQRNQQREKLYIEILKNMNLLQAMKTNVLDFEIRLKKFNKDTMRASISSSNSSHIRKIISKEKQQRQSERDSGIGHESGQVVDPQKLRQLSFRKKNKSQKLIQFQGTQSQQRKEIFQTLIQKINEYLQQGIQHIKLQHEKEIQRLQYEIVKLKNKLKNQSPYVVIDDADVAFQHGDVKFVLKTQTVERKVKGKKRLELVLKKICTQQNEDESMKGISIGRDQFVNTPTKTDIRGYNLSREEASSSSYLQPYKQPMMEQSSSKRLKLQTNTPLDQFSKLKQQLHSIESNLKNFNQKQNLKSSRRKTDIQSNPQIFEQSPLRSEPQIRHTEDSSLQNQLQEAWVENQMLRRDKEIKKSIIIELQGKIIENIRLAQEELKRREDEFERWRGLKESELNECEGTVSRLNKDILSLLSTENENIYQIPVQIQVVNQGDSSSSSNNNSQVVIYDYQPQTSPQKMQSEPSGIPEIKQQQGRPVDSYHMYDESVIQIQYECSQMYSRIEEERLGIGIATGTTFDNVGLLTKISEENIVGSSESSSAGISRYNYDTYNPYNQKEVQTDELDIIYEVPIMISVDGSEDQANKCLSPSRSSELDDGTPQQDCRSGRLSTYYSEQLLEEGYGKGKSVSDYDKFEDQRNALYERIAGLEQRIVEIDEDYEELLKLHDQQLQHHKSQKRIARLQSSEKEEEMTLYEIPVQLLVEKKDRQLPFSSENQLTTVESETQTCQQDDHTLRPVYASVESTKNQVAELQIINRNLDEQLQRLQWNYCRLEQQHRQVLAHQLQQKQASADQLKLHQQRQEIKKEFRDYRIKTERKIDQLTQNVINFQDKVKEKEGLISMEKTRTFKEILQLKTKISEFTLKVNYNSDIIEQVEEAVQLFSSESLKQEAKRLNEPKSFKIQIPDIYPSSESNDNYCLSEQRYRIQDQASSRNQQDNFALNHMSKHHHISIQREVITQIEFTKSVGGIGQEIGNYMKVDKLRFEQLQQIQEKYSNLLKEKQHFEKLRLDYERVIISSLEQEHQHLEEQVYRVPVSIKVQQVINIVNAEDLAKHFEKKCFQEYGLQTLPISQNYAETYVVEIPVEVNVREQDQFYITNSTTLIPNPKSAEHNIAETNLESQLKQKIRLLQQRNYKLEIQQPSPELFERTVYSIPFTVGYDSEGDDIVFGVEIEGYRLKKQTLSAARDIFRVQDDIAEDQKDNSLGYKVRIRYLGKEGFQGGNTSDKDIVVISQQVYDTLLSGKQENIKMKKKQSQNQQVDRNIDNLFRSWRLPIQECQHIDEMPSQIPLYSSQPQCDPQQQAIYEIPIELEVLPHPSSRTEGQNIITHCQKNKDQAQLGKNYEEENVILRGRIEQLLNINEEIRRTNVRIVEVPVEVIIQKDKNHHAVQQRLIEQFQSMENMAQELLRKLNEKQHQLTQVYKIIKEKDNNTNDYIIEIPLQIYRGQEPIESYIVKTNSNECVVTKVDAQKQPATLKKQPVSAQIGVDRSAEISEAKYGRGFESGEGLAQIPPLQKLIKSQDKQLQDAQDQIRMLQTKYSVQLESKKQLQESIKKSHNKINQQQQHIDQLQQKCLSMTHQFAIINDKYQSVRRQSINAQGLVNTSENSQLYQITVQVQVQNQQLDTNNYYDDTGQIYQVPIQIQIIDSQHLVSKKSSHLLQRWVQTEAEQESISQKQVEKLQLYVANLQEIIGGLDSEKKNLLEEISRMESKLIDMNGQLQKQKDKFIRLQKEILKVDTLRQFEQSKESSRVFQSGYQIPIQMNLQKEISEMQTQTHKQHRSLLFGVHSYQFDIRVNNEREVQQKVIERVQFYEIPMPITKSQQQQSQETQTYNHVCSIAHNHMQTDVPHDQQSYYEVLTPILVTSHQITDSQVQTEQVDSRPSDHQNQSSLVYEIPIGIQQNTVQIAEYQAQTQIAEIMDKVIIIRGSEEENDQNSTVVVEVPMWIEREETSKEDMAMQTQEWNEGPSSLLSVVEIPIQINLENSTNQQQTQTLVETLSVQTQSNQFVQPVQTSQKEVQINYEEDQNEDFPDVIQIPVEIIKFEQGKDQSIQVRGQVLLKDIQIQTSPPEEEKQASSGEQSSQFGIFEVPVEMMVTMAELKDHQLQATVQVLQQYMQTDQNESISIKQQINKKVHPLSSVFVVQTDNEQRFSLAEKDAQTDFDLQFVKQIFQIPVLIHSQPQSQDQQIQTEPIPALLDQEIQVEPNTNSLPSQTQQNETNDQKCQTGSKQNIQLHSNILQVYIAPPPFIVNSIQYPKIDFGRRDSRPLLQIYSRLVQLSISNAELIRPVQYIQNQNSPQHSRIQSHQTIQIVSENASTGRVLQVQQHSRVWNLCISHHMLSYSLNLGVDTPQSYIYGRILEEAQQEFRDPISTQNQHEVNGHNSGQSENQTQHQHYIQNQNQQRKDVYESRVREVSDSSSHISSHHSRDFNASITEQDIDLIDSKLPPSSTHKTPLQHEKRASLFSRQSYTGLHSSKAMMETLHSKNPKKKHQQNSSFCHSNSSKKEENSLQISHRSALSNTKLVLQIQNMKEENGRYRDEVARLRGTLNQMETQIANLQKERVKSIQEIVFQHRVELERLSKESQEQLEECKATMTQREQDLRRHFHQQVGFREKRLQQVEKEMEAQKYFYQPLIKGSEDKLNSLERELVEKDAQLEQLKGTGQAYESQINEINAELQIVRKKQSLLTEQLQEKQQEMQKLKESKNELVRGLEEAVSEEQFSKCFQKGYEDMEQELTGKIGILNRKLSQFKKENSKLVYQNGQLMKKQNYLELKKQNGELKIQHSQTLEKYEELRKMMESAKALIEKHQREEQVIQARDQQLELLKQNLLELNQQNRALKEYVLLNQDQQKSSSANKNWQNIHPQLEKDLAQSYLLESNAKRYSVSKLHLNLNTHFPGSSVSQPSHLRSQLRITSVTLEQRQRIMQASMQDYQDLLEQYQNMMISSQQEIFYLKTKAQQYLSHVMEREQEIDELMNENLNQEDYINRLVQGKLELELQNKRLKRGIQAAEKKLYLMGIKMVEAGMLEGQFMGNGQRNNTYNSRIQDY